MALINVSRISLVGFSLKNFTDRSVCFSWFMKHTHTLSMPSETARDLHPNDCYVCGLQNEHSLNVTVPFDVENGEVEFVHHFQGFEKGAPERSG